MKRFSALLLLLMSAISASAEPLIVEIFADGEVMTPRIADVSIAAYDLNEITYMEQNAPTFKRGSVEDSKDAAFQWLNSADYDSYKKQVMRVRYPMILISKYRLSKIPAIVFNQGDYVIYGTTDIELALHEWNRFSGSSKK